MAKKTLNEKKRQKLFVEAIKELSEDKGISDELIVGAMKEAFTIAYTKKLEDEFSINGFKKIQKKNIKDGTKLSDALVRCDIDLNEGTIDLFHQFKVTKDEDITDDFIEISDSDPKVKEAKLKVGDMYEEPISLENDFDQGDVMKFVSVFKQKISKAEKDALYELYSSKIGQLITGTVEKVDSHSIIVNLGREGAFAYLFQKDLIGNEKYNVGDSIKVFIKGISVKSSDNKKEGLIQISRSCPGFIQKLFENEVHEIFDGTVIIKDVARFAGVRSKVVVESKDRNVDPSGACIGQNGSRIQAIVTQLGNASNNQEKIDVITYKENLGLYLIECLKPGTIIGVRFENDNTRAIAIVEEDSGKGPTIGGGGCNVNLAKILTHLAEIEVLTKKEAEEKGITYKTVEEFQVEARDAERIKAREESIKKAEELAKSGAKKPQVIKATETLPQDFLGKDDFDDVDIEDEISNEPVNQTEKVEVKEEAPVETRTVNTTISLDALEANLANEKKEKKEYPSYKDDKKKSFKKDNKKSTPKAEKPAEKKTDDKVISGPKMEIYTKEELEKMELENQEVEDTTNDDFSEYDDDSYYEDK